MGWLGVICEGGKTDGMEEEWAKLKAIGGTIGHRHQLRQSIR